MTAVFTTTRAPRSRPQWQHVLAILTFFFVALAAVDAFACRCTERLNPPKEAEIGFWGTVERIKPRGSTDRVTFKIDQVYHGGHRDAVTVYTNRFHHDCGIRFEEEKSYVVYAYDFHPRGVATSMCWGTYPSETPITEKEYFDLDVDIPDSTTIEKKLRKMAQKIVRVCGHATRVTDAGFSLVLAPDGDPIGIEPDGQVARRERQFQECVVNQYVEHPSTPRPDQPVRIEGWYQKGNDRLPILLDQLPCGEDCLDWGSRVRGALFDVQLPRTEAEAKAIAERLATPALEAAREICPHEGLDAAKMRIQEDDGHAPPIEKQKMMFLDCAIVRGEFEKAKEYLEVAPNEPYRVAVNWAAANQADKPYPVRSGELSFADRWFDTNGPATPGKFRVLRRSFVEGTAWAKRPLFLEAFAESILSDEDASPGMRDLAALAYHKAAHLRPEAAEAYRELAAQADTTPELETLVAELDETYAKAKRKREAEAIAAATEEQPTKQAETTTEAPAEQGLQLDLVDKITVAIGALMILVMIVAVYLRVTRK
jgi:hypothetical protein